MTGSPKVALIAGVGDGLGGAIARRFARGGYATVLAKAKAERDVPIIQVEGLKGVHVVNKKTEMPVDRLATTMGMLQKNGGEENFAVMSDKAYDAFTAAKEADGILGLYLDISKNLTSTPGANFAQALVFYAKTKLGEDNPGVAFDALRGVILRMARAMQGSSQSLSNLDMKSVSGMLPQPTDTMPTAIHRLQIAAEIVQNMKDVQLGRMSAQSLLERIEQVKKGIAATDGMDVFSNGSVTITQPKGASHPGKGWEKVNK